MKNANVFKNYAGKCFVERVQECYDLCAVSYYNVLRQYDKDGTLMFTVERVFTLHNLDIHDSPLDFCSEEHIVEFDNDVSAWEADRFIWYLNSDIEDGEIKLCSKEEYNSQKNMVKYLIEKAGSVNYV